MEEIDVLKDILQYKTMSQMAYNEHLINLRNPEVRELFTELRDSEMRDIVKLQQKIERKKGAKGIVSKILPAKARF